METVFMKILYIFHNIPYFIILKIFYKKLGYIDS